MQKQDRENKRWRIYQADESPHGMFMRADALTGVITSLCHPLLNKTQNSHRFQKCIKATPSIILNYFKYKDSKLGRSIGF